MVAGSTEKIGTQTKSECPGSPGTRTEDPWATLSIRTEDAQAKPFSGKLPAIAGYDVVEEIGRGGMGIVYKARQLGLDRPVALKTILFGKVSNADHVARFRVEAQAIARLQHPNIVQIHEIGEDCGLPFISLELVEGGTLATKLGGVPLLPELAARIAEVLARAIQVAHGNGIIHRDLKPSNVLLTMEGIPKITDFGLAKQVDRDWGQTQSGAVIGTPSYMGPEQAAGMTELIGPKTDVYSLGAILYEMLTGRPPFRGATVLDTLDQVRSQEPLPPRRLVKVPRDLEAICLKCLEKDPRKRYESAELLADDLCRYLDGEPTVARSPGLPTRALLWCQRPQRIKEAGGFMIFISLVMATWNIIGQITFRFGFLQPNDLDAAIWQLDVVFFLLYLPLFAIGIFTVKGKPAAIWAGAFITLFNLALTIAACIGIERILPLVDMGGIMRDPGPRLPLFTLLAMFSVIQFLSFMIALVSFHANTLTRLWSNSKTQI